MPDWLSNLDHHWWWVAAGALLGILEILLPGVFLIWVALAAWGVTLLAMLAHLYHSLLSRQARDGG